MKITILILLISLSINSFSQNDTIYLEGNNVVFGNQKYNLLNSEGEKDGKWIHYKAFDVELLHSSSFIFDEDDDYWTDRTFINYRSLKGRESDGMVILVKTEIDTLVDYIHYNKIYHEIWSKIPPEEYTLESVGFYENGVKTGIWIYYHATDRLNSSIERLCIESRGSFENGYKIDKWLFFYPNGELKKTIMYKHGLPTRGYKIFRNNGTVVVEMKKLNDSIWEANRYSETGIKLENHADRIEEFDILY